MKPQKNENSVTEEKVLKPFVAPDSLHPVTQDEIDRRKRRIERAEALGQSMIRVTSEKDNEEEYENPYTVEALRYILNDMDVPDELKQKIQEFEKQHKDNLKKQTKNRYNHL